MIKELDAATTSAEAARMIVVLNTATELKQRFPMQ